MTRLTFGIPVYNGERYLSDALDSVRSQDLDDIRIIISDNGSDDATQEICRDAVLHDERIDYRRYDQNRGGIWNYRNVLALADTELFSWMAADDVKRANFARASIDALDAAGPGAVFSCPRTQIIDASGVVYEDLNDTNMGLDASTAHERIRNLLRSQASHPMYGVIRMDALRRTRGLRQTLSDDIVLLVELLCIGTMALASEHAFLQRRHDEQTSVLGVAATSWFAPGTKANRSFPETVADVELYRGVAHSDLPMREKLRSLAVLGPSWVLPRWRAVARDVASAVGVNPGSGRLRAQRAAQQQHRGTFIDGM
ncbi:glycosyltransferase family 2 protein [Paramicrobacterium agarici]|uniref:glycosyltransferase family 2 protein n=1 Tax=Paramicrobacterium agarici TaxID=630514 RepID=UPI00114EF974|nr:glycosyltransferase family A protein [Microbacterium agarici]TQO23459.1 glycosyl transferase family 2 [Microbacterium agarici]